MKMWGFFIIFVYGYRRKEKNTLNKGKHIKAY